MQLSGSSKIMSPRCRDQVVGIIRAKSQNFPPRRSRTLRYACARLAQLESWIGAGRCVDFHTGKTGERACTRNPIAVIVGVRSTAGKNTGDIFTSLVFNRGSICSVESNGGSAAVVTGKKAFPLPLHLP